MMVSSLHDGDSSPKSTYQLLPHHHKFVTSYNHDEEKEEHEEDEEEGEEEGEEEEDDDGDVSTNCTSNSSVEEITEENRGGGGGGGGGGSVRKYNRSKMPRLRWTPDLHLSFLQAVDRLGGQDRATPKLVLQLMNIKGLSIAHVKSHLQMYRSKKFDDPNQGNVQGLLFQGKDNHAYNLSQLPMLQRFNHGPPSPANSRYGDYSSWRRGHNICGTNYMGGGRLGGNNSSSLYGYNNHKPFTTKYSSCDSSPNNNINLPSSLMLKGIQVPISIKSSTSTTTTLPNHHSTTFENTNTKFLFHRWPPQILTKLASPALEESTSNDIINGGLKRKLMSMRPVRSGDHDLDLELSLKVSKPAKVDMRGNDYDAVNVVDLDPESTLSLSLSSSSSSKLSEVVRRDNKYNSSIVMNEGVDSKRARMASTLDLTL